MTRRSLEIGLAVGAATFLIAVPWLMPAVADDFWVSVITEILIWSLFASTSTFCSATLDCCRSGRRCTSASACTA